MIEPLLKYHRSSIVILIKPNAALTGNLERSVKLSECSALLELIPVRQNRLQQFQVVQYPYRQLHDQNLLTQFSNLER